MRLPIPDDWEGEYCRYAVCWPNSPQWLGILRGLLTQAARGWSWDEKSGDLLDVLKVMRDVLDKNLELDEVLMTCNDANLRSIAQAIRQLADAQCCDGAATDDQPRAFIPDGEGGTIPWIGPPLIELPEGQDYPDGYGSVAEWEVGRCNVAYAIVDGLIRVLQIFAGTQPFDFASITALITITTLGIITVPIIAIPALVSALGLMLTSRNVFNDAATYIQNNRTELACILYSTNPIGSIINAVSDFLDQMIVAILASGVARAIKAVIILLLNPTVINKLYQFAGISGGAGDDCSACTSECEVMFEHNFLNSVVNGWSQASTTCTGFNTSGTQTFSPTATGLRIGAGGGSGGLSQFIMEYSGLDLGTIGPSQFIRMTGRRLAENNFCRLTIETSLSGCSLIGTFSYSGTALLNKDFPIGQFAGQDLVKISFYANNSVSKTFQIEFTDIGVICV